MTGPLMSLEVLQHHLSLAQRDADAAIDHHNALQALVTAAASLDPVEAADATRTAQTLLAARNGVIEARHPSMGEYCVTCGLTGWHWAGCEGDTE